MKLELGFKAPRGNQKRLSQTTYSLEKIKVEQMKIYYADCIFLPPAAQLLVKKNTLYRMRNCA